MSEPVCGNGSREARRDGGRCHAFLAACLPVILFLAGCATQVVPDGVRWTPYAGGLDWGYIREAPDEKVSGGGAEQDRRTYDRYDMGRPIRVTVYVRNRGEEACVVPGDLYRSLGDGQHSWCRGIRVEIRREPLPDRHDLRWLDPFRSPTIPGIYRSHDPDVSKSSGRVLDKGQTVKVCTVDLCELFAIKEPGIYQYCFEIDAPLLGRRTSGNYVDSFIVGQPPPRLTLEQINAEIGVLGGPGVEERLRAIIDRDFQTLPPDKPGAQPLPADFPPFELGSEVKIEPEGNEAFIELSDFEKACVRNSKLIEVAVASAASMVRAEFEKRLRAESRTPLRLVYAVVAVVKGSREGALALLESMKSTDYATVLNTHSALSSALSLCSREEGAPDWVVELIIAVLSDERWVGSQGGRQGVFVRRVCALAQEDYLCLARDLGFKKCRKAVPFLLEKVRTSDADGVYVDDLVYIGDPRAIPVLLECLEKLLQNMERNRDAYVYSEYDSIGPLIDAMGAFKAREAVSLLTRHVDRLKAIKTLETIGDKRALPALRKLVEDKGVVLHEGKPVRPSDEQARWAYARIALATMEDGDSVERLCELLKDTSLTEHQRDDAVWRLSVRHDPRTVPVLVNMTRGGDGWYLAHSAIVSLQRFPCPATMDGLIACFDVQFPDKVSFTKQVYHPAEFHEDIARSLKTLTGQDLPPDKAAWEAWWKANRETFKFKDPK